jgi:hypothetical protein
MHKTQNEQKTKPNLDDYTKWRLELFSLQAVLPEQNDIILLPTIKNSATLRYTAVLNPAHAVEFCYVWQHCLQAATSIKVIWHEAALQ